MEIDPNKQKELSKKKKKRDEKIEPIKYDAKRYFSKIRSAVKKKK